MTLYIGKNNYASDVNHMMVLGAAFKANETYYVNTNGTQAWIENANGHKISAERSTMKVNKSVGI